MSDQTPGLAEALAAVHALPLVKIPTAAVLLDICVRTARERAREGHLVEGVPILRVGRLTKVRSSDLRRVLGIDEDRAAGVA